MDLERLKRLAEAATPGPWRWVDPNTDEPCLPDAPCDRGGHGTHAFTFSLRTVEEFQTASVGWLPKFIIHRAEEIHEVQIEPGVWRHPDAEYIAAVSPEVVLELLEELRILRGSSSNLSIERCNEK